MALLDWIILGSTLIFIVAYGVWKTRGNNSVDDYVRGGDDVKWWTIGLSVMATQASAITFLSTPGQAFHDGMGFVQFYFGLPLAMIVICLVFIPIYKKLKVFTAYEMLEGRFDLKTRTLTALLFLVQRGLAAGITIFAPSIILHDVSSIHQTGYRWTRDHHHQWLSAYDHGQGFQAKVVGQRRSHCFPRTTDLRREIIVEQ